MHLSIVLPCYNEERRLEKNLKLKIEYLRKQKYSWEIILVDDGSSDNTKTIAENIVANNKNLNIRLVSYKTNQGKGYAVKTGMLNAIGEFVLFADVDNSTPTEEIEKLFAYSSQFDVVIASRYLAQSKITKKQGLLRRFVSRAGNIFIRYIIGLPYKDTQCGFKLFSSSAAKKIFERSLIRRWGFDIEALLLAKRFGLKVKEVPVTWKDSMDSKLAPAKAAMMVFGEAVKSKYYIITNKYNIK